MNTDLQQKIKLLVSELTGLELSQLTNSADFAVDLNLNKAEVAEMIAGLEKQLKFELESEEVVKIKTFGRLVAVVSEKIEEW